MLAEHKLFKKMANAEWNERSDEAHTPEVLSEEADTSDEGLTGRWRTTWNRKNYYSQLNGWYKSLSKVKNINVPLRNVSIKARVEGTTANVSVEHKYVYAKRKTLKDVFFFYGAGESGKIIEVKANIGTTKAKEKMHQR